MAIEAIINSVKYWCRLRETSEDTLVHKAYTEMQSINITESNFYHTMKELLNKHKINIKSASLYILQHLKKIFQNQFLEYWKIKLMENPKDHGNKLRSYRTYKNKFRKEEYLKIESKELRGALARLRLSAHNLHIETGRYAKPNERKEPRERLCTFCDLRECEDEFHFVMRCPLYKQQRKILFENFVSLYPVIREYSEQNQFIWIMASTDIDIIGEFAKFVRECFIVRSSFEQNRQSVIRKK